MELTWDEQNEADAATVREAARHMIEHHPAGHPRYAFWLTLSRWLFDIAVHWTNPNKINSYDKRKALELCRQYLNSRGE
jgi:hypothetical protein